MGDTRVTLYTIARAAGVHPSTVSRSLDRVKSATVRPETAERIRQLANNLCYEPNPWARSLRTRRTRLIGLILPRLTDGVLAQMFEAAIDRASELGFLAVTVSTRDHDGIQRELADALLDRRVDGMILATARLEEPLLEELEAQGVPFVLMNRACGGHPVVRSDDELGGYLATRHLLAQGHRRIGMAAGPANVSTSTLRRHGYVRAHLEAGVPVDPALMIECSFACEGGVIAGSRLLALPEAPTAVFAVNDRTAVGVMSATHALGLRIPADLAVVGYNDTEVAPMLQVPLSSVAPPLDEIGRCSVDLLVRRLAGERPASVVLPARLIVRTSSCV